MALAYEARDAMAAARSPLVLNEETQPRHAEVPEIAAQHGTAPTRRLQSNSDLFARLHARRYEFMAVFEANSADPFDAILQVRRDIVFACQEIFDLRSAQTVGSARHCHHHLRRP